TGLELRRAVPLLVHLVALSPHREGDDVAHPGCVVDEQYALTASVWRVHAVVTSSRTRAGARRIRKTVPSPGDESSSMRAPSVRTDSRTIASPRPKPCASRSPR